MRRRFIALGGFTRRRRAGNPLGMAFDAAGPDTAAMPATAREFDHPEMAFVLPLQDSPHWHVIGQSCEIGRRSLIEPPLIVADGALATAAVGGDAVLVTEGRIEA